MRERLAPPARAALGPGWSRDRVWADPDGSGWRAGLGTRTDTPWKAWEEPHKCKARGAKGKQGTPRTSPSPAGSYLSHRIGEDVDDLLVGGGHHALPVDLNDPVPHADAAALCDPPSHEAADLLGSKATSPFRAAPHGGGWGDGPVLLGTPALSSLRR